MNRAILPLLLALSLAPILCWAVEPSTQQAKAGKEPIRLTLSKASAEQEVGDIVFHCEAVLVNGTGTAVKVNSHFFSAFDWIELVVFAPDGSRLVQQPYTWHQSPYSPEDRVFFLKMGENRQTLTFPVRSVPRDVNKVGVLLVGTLPDREHQTTICSNMVTVSVTAVRSTNRQHSDKKTNQ